MNKFTFFISTLNEGGLLIELDYNDLGRPCKIIKLYDTEDNYTNCHNFDIDSQKRYFLAKLNNFQIAFFDIFHIKKIEKEIEKEMISNDQITDDFRRNKISKGITTVNIKEENGYVKNIMNFKNQSFHINCSYAVLLYNPQNGLCKVISPDLVIKYLF